MNTRDLQSCPHGSFRCPHLHSVLDVWWNTSFIMHFTIWNSSYALCHIKVYINNPLFSSPHTFKISTAFSDCEAGEIPARRRILNLIVFLPFDRLPKTISKILDPLPLQKKNVWLSHVLERAIIKGKLFDLCISMSILPDRLWSKHI